MEKEIILELVNDALEIQAKNNKKWILISLIATGISFIIILIILYKIYAGG